MSTSERMAHTPGPWTLVHDQKRQVAIHAGRFKAHIAYVQFTGTDLEDGLANASLIAAAPDLLLACRAALNDRMYKEWPAVADLLKAAIIKAEGEL